VHELPILPLPVHYRAEVVAGLRRLGVVPQPTTQPRLVYRFLRALLTFEIRERKLRRRELEQTFGPQPLTDYAREIEGLRGKYGLLRRQLRDWVE
jgi:hypothetical protein